jgi:hypothetical protein
LEVGAVTESKVIEGAISLGIGVELRPTDLASTFAIRIAEHEGDLCLPGRPTASGDPAGLSPPRIYEEQITQKLVKTNWGWMLGPDSSLVTSALLRFTLSAEESAQIKIIGQRIAEEAETWRDAFLQWIQALAGQRSACMRRAPPQQSGSNVYLWFTESGKLEAARTAGHSHIAIFSPHPAPRTRIISALDKASRGIPIPLEHLLLNAAECALSELDTRRAVLDAATGAEIALRQVLYAKLAEANVQAVVECLLKRNDTIGRLIELAEVFNLTVPKGLIDRIARPRNQVAHKGTTPNWEETSRIIQASREVIHSLSPIE